ncbi:MAG: hypothetical protein JO372_09945 [Solirubrobacterales bacterium]|nr:hypothetical protein [Solirubrobacterales bacterium]
MGAAADSTSGLLHRSAAAVPLGQFSGGSPLLGSGPDLSPARLAVPWQRLDVQCRTTLYQCDLVFQLVALEFGNPVFVPVHKTPGENPGS